MKRRSLRVVKMSISSHPWFTHLLPSETSHSFRILLCRVYCSFSDHTQARSTFRLAEHPRVDLSVLQTLLLLFFWTTLWLRWSDWLEWLLELSLSAGRVVLSLSSASAARLLMPRSLSIEDYFWHSLLLLRATASDSFMLWGQLPSPFVVVLPSVKIEYFCT